jgi:hypothetical protein
MEIVKECECSGNIIGSCIKMEKWEMLKIPGMGERGKKENDGRGEHSYDIL